jgi:hypothetical protein
MELRKALEQLEILILIDESPLSHHCNFHALVKSIINLLESYLEKKGK